MNIPDDLLYNEGHMWCRREDDATVVIGISDNAQNNLGEIAFVELPEAGAILNQGEPLGIIESVKVVNELLSPVSGTVVETNDSLSDRPTLINDAPYGDGWMLRIRIEPANQLKELMNAAQYQEYIT